MIKDIDKIINDCNNSDNIEYVKEVAEQIVLTDPYTICYFAENVDLVDNLEIMQILERGIISFGDIVHIYEFMFLMVDCKRQYFNLPSFESLIRQSKNPKLMLYSIAFVPGIDIYAMLKALYATKCVKYIEKLKDPECGLEDIIDWAEYRVRLKEAQEHTYFPEALKPYRIPGTSLLNNIIKTQDPYLITELADYLEYLRDYVGLTNVDNFLGILEYTIARIPTPLHHYEFAASISSSNKPMFQKLVVDSEQLKFIFYMYKYVDGVNKKELKKIIEESDNEKYCNKIGNNKEYPAYED